LNNELILLNIAHPQDQLRFDLIIPGEQFFCLKSKSQPERQRWLVALGTCKSRGTKSTTSTTPISNNNNNNTSSTFSKSINNF
jgi:pleckstrin family protein A (phosphoinositide binding specific) protein 8